jgi:transcription antitermination factor NusG
MVEVTPVTGGISVNLAPAIEDDRHRWFALRVKCRYEKFVSTLLRDKGYDELLPLYWSRRRWSDRFQSVELPLFPGYVFCRLDPQYRLPLLTTPGVMHLVGVGRIPEPIDDSEIAAIQAAVRSGLSTEPWPFLKVGHRVRLEEGPLTGLEGIVIEERKRQRLVVSVSLLQRSIAIEIERQWVRPLDAAQPSIDMRSVPTFAIGNPCT